jgi:hypothetical protein
MTLPKLIPICFVVLASPYAVAQVPVVDRTPPEYATVLGRVLYTNGAPVEGAVVEIQTFHGLNGILPSFASPVHTDMAGRYTITYPPLGDGFIGASKLAEGYPNPLLALYNRRNTTSMKRIDLKTGALLENVDLVLEHPNPLVTFQVQDSTSGRPVDDARILAEWPEGGNFMISATVPKDGAFALVLPDHPIQVTVSAPGRMSWHWKADLAQAKSAGRPFAMHTTVVVPLAQAGP